MIAYSAPGFLGTPSGGEILLVLLVVLLLFGSKNLPRMARTLGKTLEEFRRASREVTDEIMHAADEPPEKPRKLQGKEETHASPDGAAVRGAPGPPSEEKVTRELPRAGERVNEIEGAPDSRGAGEPARPDDEERKDESA